MKASLFDRSNYYRGLLVLIGRDRIIHRHERKLALQFGQLLDFDKRFCESAIADLLDNEHINETPILFDDREIAICFMRDALRLSLVDKEINAREMAWLEAEARENRLPEGWIENEFRRIEKAGLLEFSPENSDIRNYL